MRKFFLILALIFGMMTPCLAAETVPAPTEPLSAEECKLVTDAISAKLRDPYSAKIECIGKFVFLGMGADKVWMAYADVNAKNAMGGYVGVQTWGVFLAGDHAGKATPDVKRILADGVQSALLTAEASRLLQGLRAKQ